jgi:glycosyltransferase involved in cell wall biosynthesis
VLKDAFPILNKMSEPLVSVLITTYNYGRFIEESIDSVLSQEYPADKLDIVIVDDGSTDGTAERVEKYGSRVRYFYTPNGGQAAALNFGFAKTRGEIIALLDADDYWLPGKLKRVVEEFRKDPGLGMLYHPFLEVDTQTKESRKGQFVAISGSLFGNEEKFFWFNGPGTCAVYRRKFVERLFPIPETIRMLADGYVNSLFVFVGPVLAVDECLAAYRFHGNNSYHADENEMAAETRKKRFEMKRIQGDAMRKWLADNGFTRKQLAVRAFLDRWTLYEERDEVLLSPPGRTRYFSHLMLYNRCYGPHIPARQRFINYVNALGALVVGYKHFYLLDKWRTQWIDKLGMRGK